MYMDIETYMYTCTYIMYVYTIVLIDRTTHIHAYMNIHV